MRTDINRRLVTVEGARRYGVVMAEDGSVDTAATEALRSEMRSQRGEDSELFNYGGTIEELKARCKAETGLEPPVSPSFQQSA